MELSPVPEIVELKRQDITSLTQSPLGRGKLLGHSSDRADMQYRVHGDHVSYWLKIEIISASFVLKMPHCIALYILYLRCRQIERLPGDQALCCGERGDIG